MKERILFWTFVPLLLVLGVLVSSFAVMIQPAGTVEPIQPRPQVAEASFTIKGKEVKVYALPTGTIQIKHCHHDGCLKEKRPYMMRFIRILMDRQFVEPMPIWTYYIDHPDGKFIIDTGGDQQWDDPESWACDEQTGKVARSMARVQVLQGESVTERLAAIGVKPAEIDAAVITHLHFDHTAGIRPIGAPTYVGKGDVDNAQIIGSVPCRFYEGANLKEVEPLLTGKQVNPSDQGEAMFGPSISLSQDSSLRIYSTPGHTPGSLTVELKTDQGALWFVGDITFTEAGIEEGASTAGIHTGMKEIRELHRKLRKLRAETNMTILPAHDDNTPEQLKRFSLK